MHVVKKKQGLSRDLEWMNESKKWKLQVWLNKEVSAPWTIPEWKKQSLDPSNIDNPTISSAAAYEWTISMNTSNPSPVQPKEESATMKHKHENQTQHYH